LPLSRTSSSGRARWYSAGSGQRATRMARNGGRERRTVTCLMTAVLAIRWSRPQPET
jgi:hypothetical protein